MDNASKLLELAEKLTEKTASEGKGNPVFDKLDYSQVSFEPKIQKIRIKQQRKQNRKEQREQQQITKGLEGLTRAVQDVVKPLQSMKRMFTIAAAAAAALFGIAASFKAVENFEETGNIFGDRSGMSAGHIGEKGLQLIKNKEGFRANAYKLSGEKYWTIGYGHSGPDVKQGQTITREQAEELLRKDVARFEKAVNKNVKVPISQNMFDALVSFTYNVGEDGLRSSTLLKKLNAGDYRGAQAEFGKWTKGSNGKQLGGLVKRRGEEAALFGTDIGADGKLNTEPIAVYNSPTGGNPRYDKKTNTMGGHKVTSYFGRRKAPNKGASTFHKGIDLDHKQGDPVYAFTGGTVSLAGWIQGYGNCVVVIDKKKYGHLYAHLSKIVAKKGQKVKRGDLLGYAGATTGTVKNMDAHLHYGIFKPGRGVTTNANDWIDPLTYLYPEDEDEVKKKQAASINEINASQKSNQIKAQQQKATKENQQKGKQGQTASSVKQPISKTNPLQVKSPNAINYQTVKKPKHPTN